MNYPSVSVILPTRERCDVLRHSLRTVTSQQYPNLQIIVSDNCSQDESKKVVEEACDPRVIYINTGRRLSMSQNYEFALAHVKTEWVTIV